MAITTLRLEARITLTRQCPGFIPIGGDFIAVVGRIQDINAVRQVKAALLSSQDLSVYSMNTPGFIPGIDFSDHLNYWQHDIPAIMITDTAFIVINNTTCPVIPQTD